jgi:hypothetical protein
MHTRHLLTSQISSNRRAGQVTACVPGSLFAKKRRSHKVETTADKERRLLDTSITNAQSIATLIDKANAAVDKFSAFLDAVESRIIFTATPTFDDHQ